MIPLEKHIALSLPEDLDFITQHEADTIGLSQNEILFVLITLGLKEYLHLASQK